MPPVDPDRFRKGNIQHDAALREFGKMLKDGRATYTSNTFHDGRYPEGGAFIVRIKIKAPMFGHETFARNARTIDDALTAYSGNKGLLYGPGSFQRHLSKQDDPKQILIEMHLRDPAHKKGDPKDAAMDKFRAALDELKTPLVQKA